MNRRRIVLVVLLVVGLATSYGAYHALVAQPTVVARVATSETPADDVALAAAAPAIAMTNATGSTSDAGATVAQTIVEPADSAVNSSIHLPDALEGLDSTEYRIAMMLCQDLY